MKLSIITPTHDPKYIEELKASILENEYQDWEWIILTNNGAEVKSDDNRIRVIKSSLNTDFVGALKREACSHATGDVIVEVDHDDMITHDCLEEIALAFEDPRVGFVYSDNAKLSDDFVPYDPQYGWTWKEFRWKDKNLKAMNSLPLTPGRLGHIWFAPDHVRSWRKEVYDFIGGHNPELEICDDLDLMHRLYMVTKFKYIPKVLYVYRINGENTWLKKNKDIQQKSREIYNNDIQALSLRYAQIHGLLSIDLCGGFNKPHGFTSIDKHEGDIVADLDKGIPLADNSCGVIRAYDALEHIKDKMQIMDEIHRVLANGGILLSMTPSTDGRGAYQDPTHVSFWNENSFWYYTRKEQAQYIRNDKMFFASELATVYPSEWHQANNISYARAFLEKI